MFKRSNRPDRSSPRSEAGQWVGIFEGDAFEVGMLAELLRQQSIPTLTQPLDPMTALGGSVSWPSRRERLLIRSSDREAHRSTIEDVLSVLSSPPAIEDETEPPPEV
jgi:hypothetical protein